MMPRRLAKEKQLRTIEDLREYCLTNDFIYERIGVNREYKTKISELRKRPDEVIIMMVNNGRIYRYNKKV